MTKIIPVLMTFLLLTCATSPSLAWTLWGSSEPLLTINDQEYQTEDYLNWWYEWREGDQLPESPDPYIDWLLLADEAAQMQLQDKPSYQKKLATFIKVRSLMLLKKEEIDDKIKTADDKTLRQFYRQNYTPRWQLRTISFKEQLGLQQFVTALETSPESSAEDLLETLSLSDTDYSLSSVIWERPNQLPAQILDLLKKVQDQRFSEPYPWGATWQIIEVLATETDSDEDFNQLRRTLIQHHRKQQQATLTAKLMQQLKKKYPVTIDKTLLEEIQYEGVPEGQSQKIVLEMLSHQVTAAELYTAAKKQYEPFSAQQKNKVPFSQTLHQVISAIVSQNLVDAEAIDRHYEKRPPLKNTFDFYRKHRLIKELERQLIQPETLKVTAEAVKQAYDQRKDQPSGPILVEIIRGETTDPDLAKQLHKKLRQGEDVAKIMAVLGNGDSKSDRLPLQHLSQPLQQFLETLQPGQAGMVEEDNNFVFVQLVKSPQQEIVAFAAVKGPLEAEMKRLAFLKRKREIVQQLREHSTISIDQQQWQRCLDILKEEK